VASPCFHLKFEVFSHYYSNDPRRDYRFRRVYEEMSMTSFDLLSQGKWPIEDPDDEDCPIPEEINERLRKLG
jgi:hypothetical protein